MSNEPLREQTYRTILPIESLVAGQINRILEFRSKKIFEYYEEAVEALIDLLPPEIEQTILIYKKNNNINYDLSVEGKNRYVDLFREIKKQLNDCNIVWHRGSYAIGHD
jgi:hypothetical protein